MKNSRTNMLIFENQRERNAYTQCKCGANLFFFFVCVCLSFPYGTFFHSCRFLACSLLLMLLMLFHLFSFIYFLSISISRMYMYALPLQYYISVCVCLYWCNETLFSNEWNVSSKCVCVFLYAEQCCYLCVPAVGEHDWNCKHAHHHHAVTCSVIAPNFSSAQLSHQFNFRSKKNKIIVYLTIELINRKNCWIIIFVL